MGVHYIELLVLMWYYTRIWMGGHYTILYIIYILYIIDFHPF